MVDLYAVIGNPILHSKSPQLMNKAFTSFGLKAHYTRISSDNIEDALFLVEELQMKGINCTSPYKASLLQHAHLKSEEVLHIEAANTLVKKGNKWTAYNTDINGVWFSLEKEITKISDPKILIIGAGGAAASAAIALHTYKYTFTICNRTLSKAELIAEKFSGTVLKFEELYQNLNQFDVVISTVDSRLLDRSKIVLKKNIILFDAIYKQSIWSNILKLQGGSLISGKEWLIHQGIEAFGLFTEKDCLYHDWSKAFAHDHLQKKKIALIGFMGSGKSAVANQLARVKDWSLIETDNWIENKYHLSIKDIFKIKGEKEFREMETEALKAAISSENKIISCGGGIISLEENRKILQENCLCIWLYIDLKSCLERTKGNNRPLLNHNNPSEIIDKLMHERKDLYAICSDLIINSIDKTVEEIAKKINEEINQAGYS